MCMLNYPNHVSTREFSMRLTKVATLLGMMKIHCHVIIRFNKPAITALYTSGTHFSVPHPHGVTNMVSATVILAVWHTIHVEYA